MLNLRDEIDDVASSQQKRQIALLHRIEGMLPRLLATPTQIQRHPSVSLCLCVKALPARPIQIRDVAALDRLLEGRIGRTKHDFVRPLEGLGKVLEQRLGA